MAVLDDMDRKLDLLLERSGEEINYPPSAFAHTCYAIPQTLPLGNNLSVPWSVIWTPRRGRSGDAYLDLQLRTPDYLVVVQRSWKLVYRDPITQQVIEG